MKKTNQSIRRTVAPALMSLFVLMAACGKKSASEKTLTAGSLTQPNASLQISAEASFNSPSKASLTSFADNLFANSQFDLTGADTDPYPGIGVNSGESVVDGFKIYLTSISLEQETKETAQIIWPRSPLRQLLLNC